MNSVLLLLGAAVLAFLTVFEVEAAQYDLLDHLHLSRDARNSFQHAQRQRRTVNFINRLIVIGNCSYPELAVATGACASLLFEPYRENTKENCTSQYPVYIQCLQSAIGICLRELYTPAQIAIWTKRAGENLAATINRKNLCVDGGSQRVATANLTSRCDATFPQRYADCVKPFHVMFDKDRGNAELCEQAQHTNICAFKAMMIACRKDGDAGVMGPTLTIARIMTSKKANFFCRKNQGGPDAAAILRGDREAVIPAVEPPPSRGAGHTIAMNAWVIIGAVSLALKSAGIV